MNKGSFNPNPNPNPAPGHTEEAKPNKPAFEVRIGMIKATIWAKPLEDGVAHNVTFSRIYRSGEEWRRTDSFGRDDLLVVAKVADLAHTWIWEEQSSRKTK